MDEEPREPTTPDPADRGAQPPPPRPSAAGRPPPPPPPPTTGDRSAVRSGSGAVGAPPEPVSFRRDHPPVGPPSTTPRTPPGEPKLTGRQRSINAVLLLFLLLFAVANTPSTAYEIGESIGRFLGPLALAGIGKWIYLRVTKRNMALWTPEVIGIAVLFAGLGAIQPIVERFDAESTGSPGSFVGAARSAESFLQPGDGISFRPLPPKQDALVREEMTQQAGGDPTVSEIAEETVVRTVLLQGRRVGVAIVYSGPPEMISDPEFQSEFAAGAGSSAGVSFDRTTVAGRPTFQAKGPQGTFTILFLEEGAAVSLITKDATTAVVIGDRLVEAAEG
jgi:hypothetical protein